MNFNYTGTGSINFYGCSSFTVNLTVFSPYVNGDILYVLSSAVKYGIMESVGVRKIEAIKISPLTYILLLTDTYNAVWNMGLSGIAPNNNSPLVQFDVAKQICIDYWNNKINTDLEYATCQLPYLG